MTVTKPKRNEVLVYRSENYGVQKDYELEEDQSQKQETKKIIDKIQWLKKYVDNNMSFWSDYKK